MGLICFAPIASGDCVVLLHGLGRSPHSMRHLERVFVAEGFRVENTGYRSRSAPIERLAVAAVEAGVDACSSGEVSPIHFVTHSMGGILVRAYLADRQIPQLGRVVMLAPPNQGSEIVDSLARVPGFDLLNGPAGAQLGTAPDSLPKTLGPVEFPLGVIAGTRTINPLLSQYLPNPDDGKVSVASTRVAGMSDFVTVRASHPMIIRNKKALNHAVTFIKMGHFARKSGGRVASAR